jgi:hypothetical protein
MITQLQSLTRPAFALTEHLQRSAEVSAFNLTAHLRPRQTVNVVRSTCKLLRRVL